MMGMKWSGHTCIRGMMRGKKLFRALPHHTVDVKPSNSDLGMMV